jgi:hypothetical protein
MNRKTRLSAVPSFLVLMFPTIASADVIYVASSTLSTSSIGVYDSTTGAAINSAFITNPPGISVFTMALDGSGNLIVNESYAGLTKYNATTGALLANPFTQGYFNGSSGIAVGLGNLYWGGNNGQVGEFNATTGALVNTSFITGIGNSRFTTNINLALDASNNLLYVCNNNVGNGPTGGTIGVYNATTGAVINANLVTGLGNPLGIAVDGLGHLYAVNSYTGDIGEYNAMTGAVINPALVTGLNNPSYVALDGSGDLFVTNYGSGTTNDGSIGEYNATTGAVINAGLVTGLDGADGIVIAPSASVPEPSGFVLLAFVAFVPLAVWGLRAARKPAPV